MGVEVGLGRLYVLLWGRSHRVYLALLAFQFLKRWVAGGERLEEQQLVASTQASTPLPPAAPSRIVQGFAVCGSPAPQRFLYR